MAKRSRRTKHVEATLVISGDAGSIPAASTILAVNQTTRLEEYTKMSHLKNIWKIAFLVCGVLSFRLTDATADAAGEKIPQESKDFYAHGTDSLWKGDFDAALADFDRILASDPNNVEILMDRGVAYAKKSEWDHAIRDFGKVLELDPSSADAHYNRGRAYAKKGELKRAFRDYDEALRLNPSDAGAYVNRANVYAVTHEYDRAIQDWNVAIELNPQLADAYNNRGIIYLLQGKPERARPDILKARALGYPVSTVLLSQIQN